MVAAERGAAIGVAAVHENAFQRRQRSTQRVDVRRCLAAAAEYPERLRIGAREVLRCDGRRGGRAQLAQVVRLDHRFEPGVLE